MRPYSESDLERARRRAPSVGRPILVYGVVGGIGAGKSVASAQLAGPLGEVLDADREGHHCLDLPEIRDALVDLWGDTILDPSNLPEPTAPMSPSTQSKPPSKIDRRRLGALVFNDAAALHELERLMHPRMMSRFQDRIDNAARRGVRRVVVDAAVLFEAGWNILCDHVVYLDVPQPLRLQRLVEQRQWSESELARREAAQWPLELKRSLADVVIPNADGPEALTERLGILRDRWDSSRIPQHRPSPRDESTGLRHAPV